MHTGVHKRQPSLSVGVLRVEFVKEEVKLWKQGGFKKIEKNPRRQ